MDFVLFKVAKRLKTLVWISVVGSLALLGLCIYGIAIGHTQEKWLEDISRLLFCSVFLIPYKPKIWKVLIFLTFSLRIYVLIQDLDGKSGTPLSSIVLMIIGLASVFAMLLFNRTIDKPVFLANLFGMCCLVAGMFLAYLSMVNAMDIAAVMETRIDKVLFISKGVLQATESLPLIMLTSFISESRRTEK
jgi:uncharacterized membrane protein YuzA (DUF378 family)